MRQGELQLRNCDLVADPPRQLVPSSCANARNNTGEDIQRNVRTRTPNLVHRYTSTDTLDECRDHRELRHRRKGLNDNARARHVAVVHDLGPVPFGVVTALGA